MLITRIWWSITRRRSRLFASLDFETARALRETIHAVARQGVDVAAGYQTPQGQGTIGTVVRVEEAYDGDGSRLGYTPA